MAEQRDALTALVQEQVGAGRPYSTRSFAERAVDPETGYSPGKSLIGKVIGGQSFQVSPELVRALAVGLGLPVERVARAAAEQFIGYVPGRIDMGPGADVVVGKREGATAEDMPRVREWAEHVLRSERGE